MELRVWAIHSFKAQEPDEFPGFSMGDEIIVVEKDDGFDDGWWKGISKDGLKVGIFPSNFVSHHDPSLKTDISNAEKENILTINTKCLPISVANWSIEDVSTWLDSLDGFSQYKSSFAEHQMDGNALISPFLDINALKELGIFQLERRLFLMHKITELKRDMKDLMALSNSSGIQNTPSPPSPAKSFTSIPGISSAAILQKSQLRQKKRSQTVDVTPMVPQSIKTLKDVLLLPPDYPSQVEAMNVESCDFRGYLHKRGGHAHWSWKKRYFVLKHMTLWYFKSSSPVAKVLGLIILPSYQILPARNTNMNNGMFTFIASHPDARTYWFRADTVQDMTSWMNAMVRASLGLPSPSSPSQLPSSRRQSLSSSSIEIPRKEKSLSPHPLGLDASIAVQMEALIKNVKELHTQGKKLPPPIPLKPGNLTYKPPMSFSELQRRETILESVNLKSSMEYVLWINSVLFSSDVIIIRDANEEKEIDIPQPPSYLEPVRHLHLDVTDGIHLIEFLLRLLAKEFVRENYEMEEKILCDAISRMFTFYRHLTIPKPNFRVQMVDNLQNVFRIISSEIKVGRFSHWTLDDIRKDVENEVIDMYGKGKDETSCVMERLSKLNVSVEGVYQGNLEQILLLMNEIERVFPMDEELE